MAGDDFATLRALIGSLREDLATHRGDVRESLAKLEGAIEVLGATKNGEHRRIDADVAQLSHRVSAVDSASKAAHRRLDDLPRSEQLATTDGLARDTARRLDRQAWLTVGAALGGGVAGGASSALTLLQLAGA